MIYEAPYYEQRDGSYKLGTWRKPGSHFTKDEQDRVITPDLKPAVDDFEVTVSTPGGDKFLWASEISDDLVTNRHTTVDLEFDGETISIDAVKTKNGIVARDDNIKLKLKSSKDEQWRTT